MPVEPVNIRFIGLSDAELAAQAERQMQMLEDLRRIEREMGVERQG